jgi:hypothetical protein
MSFRSLSSSDREEDEKAFEVRAMQSKTKDRIQSQKLDQPLHKNRRTGTAKHSASE